MTLQTILFDLFVFAAAAALVAMALWGDRE